MAEVVTIGRIHPFNLVLLGINFNPKVADFDVLFILWLESK